MRNGICLAVMLATLGHGATALAAPISAYSGIPMVESFENIPGTPGVSFLSGPGVFVYAGDLSLRSGMVLRDLDPGDQIDVLILDADEGEFSTGIFGGETIDSADDMPSGAACIAGNNTDVLIEFPELAAEAGAYVSAGLSTVTVSVYDAADVLIESQTVAAVNIAGWKTNFVGFGYPTRRIASLRVSGPAPLVDLVGYSPSPPSAQRVTIEPEPTGANCATGGVRIIRFADSDGNGVFDTGEGSASSYVCNGAPGAEGEPGGTGASGLTALVATSDELAGSNCAGGGTRIDAGIDDDGDAVLEAVEVDSTTYVCNGTNGADGADGINGTNGTDGMNGTDGGCSAVGVAPFALAVVLLLNRARRKENGATRRRQPSG